MSFDLLLLVDKLPEYCENSIENAIFDTPFNALSNLSFIFAGFALFMLAKRQDRLNYVILSLIILTFSVGIGSGLWHTFPNRLTYLLDIIPIFLFQISFIVIYAFKILKWNKISIIVSTLLFAVITILLTGMPDVLNGSIAYIPTLLVLIVFGLFHYFRNFNERYILIVASVLFLISLIFRSIDLAVCNTIPIGTHFLWHIFNGAVLYLATKGIIFNLSSEG